MLLAWVGLYLNNLYDHKKFKCQTRRMEELYWQS